MHSTNMEPADTYCRVFEGLEFNCKTPLDSVWILVILNESHRYNVAEKSTLRQCCFARETHVRERHSIGIGTRGHHVAQAKGSDSWPAAKSKYSGCRIQ